MCINIVLTILPNEWKEFFRSSKKKITCQKFYERGRTLVGLKNDSKWPKFRAIIMRVTILGEANPVCKGEENNMWGILGHYKYGM